MGKGKEQQDHAHHLHCPLEEVQGTGVSRPHAVQNREADESREADVGNHVLPVGEGKLDSIVEQPVEEGGKESVATRQ